MQQQAGLAAAAAAVFDHARTRAHRAGDVRHHLLQQCQFGAGGVVLGLVGDLFEQGRAVGVVEVLGRQGLGVL